MENDLPTSDPDKPTETQVQDAAIWWLRRKQHRIVVPNASLFRWESDLISVTKAGYVHDLEIKTTRSDFLADQRKRRTDRLDNYEEQVGKRYYDGPGDDLRDPFGDRSGGHHLPNRFYYVVRCGLVELEEIPRWAGLVTYRFNTDENTVPSGSFEKVKQAPSLHSEHVVTAQWRSLARKLFFRYWKQRLDLESSMI